MIRRHLIAIALFVMPVLLTATGNPCRAGQGRSVWIKGFSPRFGGGWTEEAIEVSAKHYDLLILGSSVKKDHVMRLGRHNPDLKVILGGSLYGSFDVSKGSSLERFMSESHPEWFLRLANGSIVRTYQSKNPDPERLALDRGNRELQDFMIQRLTNRVRRLEADGIWEDNVFPGFSYPNVAGGQGELARYRTEGQWQAGINKYLSRLKRALGDKMLVINAVTPWTGAADLLVIETVPHGGRKWEVFIDRCSDLTAKQGKGIGMICRKDGGRPGDVRFELGSYLLVANELSYVCVLPREFTKYTVQEIDQDFLRLGPPLEPFFRKGSMYFRRYKEGVLAVNPSPMAAGVTIRQGPSNRFRTFDPRSSEILPADTTIQ